MSLEIFYVIAILSLFLVVSVLAFYLAHSFASHPNSNALIIGCAVCGMLGLMFFFPKYLLVSKSQRRFMLGFALLLIWFCTTIGWGLWSLESRSVSIEYYYALVGVILFLLLFYVYLIFTILNNLAKK